MHSPNVVRLVMAESGRGQEVVITQLPDLPQKKGALTSPIKKKSATPYRAVSISFHFQGQDFTVIILMVNMYYIVYSDYSTTYFILQARN